MKDAVGKNIQFYKGKRVLVTGHTGFKGAWLTAILHYLEADSVGYALSAEPGSLYCKMHGDGLIRNVTGDLGNTACIKKTVTEFQPEIVFHLAAFGFVKECFADPLRAYRDNVLGTANLLEALRTCDSVRSIVLVSTDKVYENHGDGAVYEESDLLGGVGPYAASKTGMEILARDYRETYFQTKKNVGIATVRASNVLGGGDHIQSRLVPTILRSVAEGTPVELRHPEQTRPWQSVLDALNGYLTVGRYLYQEPDIYAEAWNIGPTIDGIRSVGWVFNRIRAAFQGLESCRSVEDGVQESQTLGLDIHKALTRLDWQPIVPLERTLRQLVEFFQGQQDGQWERDLCREQIEEFYGGQYEKELGK